MIDEKLKILVKEEADKLLIHATSEERNNLDFETLNPDHGFFCIYGQMTNSCYSLRARELLEKCTNPYTSMIDKWGYPEKKSFLHGSRDFSPIEFYIVQEGSRNYNLISYLKGESKNLELEW